MFLHNFWYAAAWSNEIGRMPFARTICNEPIVFYRTQAGSVVALEDRCCHRRLPLHMGKVVDDNLQCHYHGLTFDPSGLCVKVPGQPLVPPRARVRSYPTREMHGLLWLFLGRPELEHEVAIPDYHWITDPEWGAKGTYFHVQANYMLIVENLLDLTHLAFVHSTTIGNSAVVEAADVNFKRGPNSVDVTRIMKNSPPPPTYIKAGGFAGKIDRWQFINFAPPGFVRLETGGCDAGGQDDPNAKKIALRNLNIITPETERTTHYFWAQCHDFDVGNQSTTNMIFEETRKAFMQDVELFEAQQLSIALNPSAPEIDLNGDIGGLQARRIVRQLLERQTGANGDRS
jgi:phenylpropionate dioxygenase-like ring-hydroxylating dioxygenase large terminal subunit